MFEKGFVSGEILSESFHFLKRPVSYNFTSNVHSHRVIKLVMCTIPHIPAVIW
ncbi:hypothetical protein HanPSC8_Chr02g0064361 [Helianthus annuus]|nr:hypothetical protein HanPSC8_Chr02g0064361 [Helianthus annuus]